MIELMFFLGIDLYHNYVVLSGALSNCRNILERIKNVDLCFVGKEPCCFRQLFHFHARM